MIVWTAPYASVTVNAVGAMPMDRRPLGNKIVGEAADRVLHDGGGLLKILEADDAALRKVLDPDLWWVRHRNEKNLDGVCIAGTRNRTSAGTGRWLPGAPASPVNDPRPILVVPVVVDGHSVEIDISVSHLPKPKGGARAAEVMFDRIRDLQPDEHSGDYNVRLAAIRRRYPRYDVRAREVIGTMARPENVKLGKAEGWDVLRRTTADDHPGLYVSARARVRIP